MNAGHKVARVFPKWMYGHSVDPEFWNYQTRLQCAIWGFGPNEAALRLMRRLLCSKYILRVSIPIRLETPGDVVLRQFIEEAQDTDKRADYVWYRTPVCQVAMGLKALDLPVLLVVIIASWTAEASVRMINELPMDVSWEIAKLIKHKSFN